MADEPIQQNNVPSQAEGGDLAKLKECEAKRDEYLNSWKRAAADLANYKKDEDKRFMSVASYTQSAIVKDLLPVLDSFGFAITTVDKENPAYKGILMIQNQFLEILKRQGVEKIPVARGDVFNPAMHEAMMEEEAPPATAGKPDEQGLSGKILEELVAGYKMNDHVIRATKVKLAK